MGDLDLRILVIGGNSLVGGKLVCSLRQAHYSVFGTYFQHRVDDDLFYPLDITDAGSVSNVYDMVKPDMVILCSAFTNVDGCEKDKDTARKINVDGTGIVANTVEHHQGKLVYISTDYVFDGCKGSYIEEDAVCPVNYYGGTKRWGEEVVQKTCSDYLICRTSVVYGVSKPNFSLWLIDQIQNKHEVHIVNDQYVSCTYNHDLAEQIIALLKNQKQGIYHTTGGERISRYEFSIKLAEVFGFDTGLIKPVSMKDFSWVAQRPADSSLDVTKVSMLKKPYMVSESLRLFKQEYMDKNNEKKRGVECI